MFSSADPALNLGQSRQKILVHPGPRPAKCGPSQASNTSTKSCPRAASGRASSPDRVAVSQPTRQPDRKLTIEASPILSRLLTVPEWATRPTGWTPTATPVTRRMNARPETALPAQARTGPDGRCRHGDAAEGAAAGREADADPGRTSSDARPARAGVARASNSQYLWMGVSRGLLLSS